MVMLKGWEYLRKSEPCTIHRDLYCSNLFIDGHVCLLKIGDLGLAARVRKQPFSTFSSPELYEENYPESVGIYSFGMCVVEMVTLDIAYCQCDNAVKIYNKMSARVRSVALNKVKDPKVKAFIEKCLVQPGLTPRPRTSSLIPSFMESVMKKWCDHEVKSGCIVSCLARFSI